jgi:hypothetical protein
MTRVLDVFSAIIHESKTGEKVDWWVYSNIRKLKQSQSQKKSPH